MVQESRTRDWWAEGLAFENCNCAAVCPGHIHFSQKCTHDVCHGFWAMRFRRGECDGVDLSGVDVVMAFECPPVMIEGGWKGRIIVSDRASKEQAQVVEAILRGKRGGPWEVLARFVSDWLETRTTPIRIEDEPTRKAIAVADILKATVNAIRGRDRSQPVTFRNIYNQIHDSEQVVAMGSTEYDDGEIAIRTDGTHGLWSHFRWAPES